MLAEPNTPNVRRTSRELEQLQFVRRRLEQASLGWGRGVLDDSEVTAKAPGGMLWEVIGLRVQGFSGVLMGAVQFRQRQGGGFARQSLPSFLGTAASVDQGYSATERALISVELPSAFESVPEFLRRLAGAAGRSHVLVDRALIRLVFDLRSKNPSTEKLSRAPSSEFQAVVLRTVEGHVVSGNLFDTARKLRSDLPFIALTMGVQHSAHGNVPLPTLCIERRYVSMLLKVEEPDCLQDKLNLGSFQPESANPMHLIFGD